MLNKLFSYKFSLFSALLVAMTFFTAAFNPFVPVTGSGIDAATAEEDTLPTLVSFVEELDTDDEGTLAGIYIEDKMAFPVVQQPSDKPAYVSTMDDVVTEFAMARKYNAVGLLAHNYLAGADFSNIVVNDYLVAVYSDGSTQYYQVYDIQSYQALSPYDPYSNFLDLETNATLTSTELFLQTYGLGNVMVLQTCIKANDEPSWGRLFVMAIPVEEPVETLVDADFSYVE